MATSARIAAVVAIFVTGYVVGYFVVTPAAPGAMAAGPTTAAPGEAAAVGALYTPTVADRQVYWFGRYTVSHLAMMSGMGPTLPGVERVGSARATGLATALGPLVGFDPEQAPVSPGCVREIYASGDPRFTRSMDLADWSTMRWDPRAMDQTLVPAAQAFLILKSVAPEPPEYRELPFERFAALVRLTQARALAEGLAERLKDGSGLFVERRPDGMTAPPRALDQSAALWAFARLAHLAADPALPLHRRMLGDATRYHQWADAAFVAAQAVQPATGQEVALAIEAMTWYATATLDAARREEALRTLRILALRLLETKPTTLSETAFAVYGLLEAAGGTGELAFRDRAVAVFRTDMERLWNPDVGAYATEPGARRYPYDAYLVGGVLAALNAVRFHSGAEGEARLAEERYVRLVETMFGKAGLLLATGVAAVPARYRWREPLLHFTHPALAPPVSAGGRYGRPPVYAREVTWDGERWAVSDGRFHTAPAMFLALMSGWLRGSKADAFAPRRASTPGGGMMRSG